MRGVIMAGGSGSRLRPLTCDLPKPMVPILNRPVMHYTIELLKKYGVNKIAVTLAYLPGAIKDYFGDGKALGVDLHYFIEKEPLGTAGSVKNAASFLPETFIVISGDALTDINIEEVVAFHREKRSWATLVLHKQQVPLEYGVVITGEDGRIERFLEKPSWGEVFSDTVNTGIYILEPKVMNYFEKGCQFDFSKDLFPKLLADGAPIYGYVSKGYWCDIGDLSSYHLAQEDALEGKVAIDFVAHQVEPGIWLEDDYCLAGVRLVPPVYIGKGCTLEKGCNVGPRTVINDFCRIAKGASLKRSTIWQHSQIGEGTEVRGAIICNEVNIGDGSRVFEDAVIGSRTVLGEETTLRPAVKAWPDKVVAAETVLNQNLVWGSRLSRRLFGRKDIKGRFNVEVTPEFASRLGSAFASLVGEETLIVTGDNTEAAALVADALSLGILACGAKVVRASGLVVPMARFAVRHYKAGGGVHVRLAAGKREQLHLEFIGPGGANFNRNWERNLEKAMNSDCYKRVGTNKVDLPQRKDEIPRLYFAHWATKLQALGPKKKKPGPLIILGAESELVSFLGGSFLSHIGCGVRRTGNTLVAVINEVRRNAAEFGVFLTADGEGLTLVDEKGTPVGIDEYRLLSMYLAMSARGKSIVIPHDAPQALEKMARGIKIKKVKSDPGEVMAAMLSNENDDRLALQYLLGFDSIQATARIADFLTRRRILLSRLLEKLPSLNYKVFAVPCQWNERGRVLRQLATKHSQEQVELYEGVKIWDHRGWALVLPDSEKPHFNIYAQGHNEEFAEELAAEFKERVTDLLRPEQLPGKNS